MVNCEEHLLDLIQMINNQDFNYVYSFICNHSLKIKYYIEDVIHYYKNIELIRYLLLSAIKRFGIPWGFQLLMFPLFKKYMLKQILSDKQYVMSILYYDCLWKTENSSILPFLIKVDWGELTGEELYGQYERLSNIIEYVSDELKNDQSFILEAIRFNRCAIEFASESLKKDKDFIYEVVKANAYAIECIDYEMRRYKKIIKVAVKQDIELLGYAHYKIHNDEKFMYKMILSNCKSVIFLGTDLCKNKSFLHSIIKYWLNKLNIDNELLYELKQNYDEIISDNHPNYYKIIEFKNYIGDYYYEFLTDDEIKTLSVIAFSDVILENYFYYLLHKYNIDESISYEYEKQESINESITKKIKELQNDLQNDKKLALNVIKKNALMLFSVNKELLNDKEFMLEAIKLNSWSLQYASEELKNNKEFIIEAIKTNSNAMIYVNEELKKDKEVVLTAINNNCYAFQYVSKELQNDKEILQYIENVEKNDLMEDPFKDFGSEIVITDDDLPF